jgi:hypothetical protein
MRSRETRSAAGAIGDGNHNTGPPVRVVVHNDESQGTTCAVSDFATQLPMHARPAAIARPRTRRARSVMASMAGPRGPVPSPPYTRTLHSREISDAGSGQ